MYIIGEGGGVKCVGYMCVLLRQCRMGYVRIEGVYEYIWEGIYFMGSMSFVRV